MLLLFTACMCQLIVEVACDLTQLALTHLILALIGSSAVSTTPEVLRLRELIRVVVRFEEEVSCRTILILFSTILFAKFV